MIFLGHEMRRFHVSTGTVGYAVRVGALYVSVWREPKSDVTVIVTHNNKLTTDARLKVRRGERTDDALERGVALALSTLGGDVMLFAYADPPYLGMGRLYADRHPESMTWDDPETHRALIARLCDEYADGWAMSLHTPSLRVLLPMCPDDVRVCAWVKPFASFKPGVTVAYAWEPVIIRGGRKRPKSEPTVRDWVSCNIAMRRGFPGAKPEAFCFWIFEVLGMTPNDEFHDLFPGSGAVTSAWKTWARQGQLFRSGAQV